MTDQPSEEVTEEATVSIDQLTDEELTRLEEEGRKEDEALAAQTDEKGFLIEEGSDG
jgi:hypothetical protein